jgi:hypothetical protein
MSASVSLHGKWEIVGEFPGNSLSIDIDADGFRMTVYSDFTLEGLEQWKRLRDAIPRKEEGYTLYRGEKRGHISNLADADAFVEAYYQEQRVKLLKVEATRLERTVERAKEAPKTDDEVPF